MTPNLNPHSNTWARPMTAALLGAAAATASAQTSTQAGLTPARYFECHIAARQASVVGLQERVAMLSKGNSTNAEQQAAGELSRNRVSLAFYQCGYTAGALGAYAHRNAEELRTWLNANPQVKARLDAEAQRVSSLSAQMPAVSPSAKR